MDRSADTEALAVRKLEENGAIYKKKCVEGGEVQTPLKATSQTLASKLRPGAVCTVSMLAGLAKSAAASAMCCCCRHHRCRRVNLRLCSFVLEAAKGRQITRWKSGSILELQIVSYRGERTRGLDTVVA